MNTERLHWEVWSNIKDIIRETDKMAAEESTIPTLGPDRMQVEHIMAMIDHLRACNEEFVRARNALRQAADDLHQYWEKEGGK